jgi:DNA-binding PadR family transcriptional regulator
LRTLHKLGLVALTKEVRNRPQTSYSLTTKGRAAFKDYLDVLEQIVKAGKK